MSIQRRTFLSMTLALLAGRHLPAQGDGLPVQRPRNVPVSQPLTIQKVIDSLLADIPGAPFIVVWRFHDGIHAHKPDGIRMGVLQALGWQPYYDDKNPPLVVLPNAMSLSQLMAHLKKSLSIDAVKYIGDQNLPCSKIVLSPGAAGGTKHITTIEKYQPDVFVCGELNEWETSEYIRDACYQGKKIALVVLGHSVSEEPGMEWLVPVLKQKVPGVAVTHLPSGDAFSLG
jgi:hypothetical protein